MYKINELSKLANVSTRTLRYYDTIGLLSPALVGENNYRLYTSKEVDLLQQILFYKELGFSLKKIRSIIYTDDFDFLVALNYHKRQLIMKKNRLNKLLETIDKTIEKEKGERNMSDNEKFINLKEKLINENNEKFGDELEELYGRETITTSHDKLRKMSRWELEHADKLRNDINQQLSIALATGNPKSVQAMKVCKMHQEWIKLYWNTYTIEAHLSLTEMYTSDSRFREYYEKSGKGATDFLFAAMKEYLKKDHI